MKIMKIQFESASVQFESADQRTSLPYAINMFERLPKLNIPSHGRTFENADGVSPDLVP